jgi:SEC-C motif-containing protein
MRARYSAYTTGDIDFIVKSHDPDRAKEVDRKNTETWSKQSEWMGLEILSTEQGQPTDDVGVVEFVARYKLSGVKVEHRERALFRKVGQSAQAAAADTTDGRWVFVDGIEIKGPPVKHTEPRVGRNDPCPCGSGKKYKKCHGVAA